MPCGADHAPTAVIVCWVQGRSTTKLRAQQGAAPFPSGRQSPDNRHRPDNKAH